MGFSMLQYNPEFHSCDQNGHLSYKISISLKEVKVPLLASKLNILIFLYILDLFVLCSFTEIYREFQSCHFDQNGHL